jgi:hypothetical protein
MQPANGYRTFLVLASWAVLTRYQFQQFHTNFKECHKLVM